MEREELMLEIQRIKDLTFGLITQEKIYEIRNITTQILLIEDYINNEEKNWQ